MIERHNKLVRDKIPEIILQQGDIPITRQLDDREYFAALNNKLAEEVSEYFGNYSIEELADIVEVIYALAKHQGLSIEDFEEIRQRKFDERGGFEGRISLIQVERNAPQAHRGSRAPTFEETQEALDQMIDDLPPDIFKGLNGGVALVPDAMYDENGLLILGHYHVQPYGLGRYVSIYYGSMMAAYGHYGPQAFRERVKDTLYHELTHHLESLAGDRTLEKEDARTFARLLARR